LFSVQTKIISTAEENQQNQASFHPALDVFTKIFAGIMQQQQSTTPTAPTTTTTTTTTAAAPTMPLTSFLVNSNDDTSSPVLQLLVQRLKPVITDELVRQVKTTYQFHIATLGSFYIDLRAGACSTGTYPGSSTDVTITLANAEDLRLLSTNDSNELVQAYLNQRITIDGSLQDALLLKHVADALRRENIFLFK